MRIYHPHTGLHGAERENSFIVEDMAQAELGQGWLRVFTMREIMPERPIRVCFEMEAHPQARDILFGALMTRARLLCKQRTGEAARIYTVCNPQEKELIEYYQQNGMIVNDGNDLYVSSMRPPANQLYPPNGTQVQEVFLRNNAEYEALLSRVNRYSMEKHSDLWVSEISQMPYFTSLGVYYGQEMVSEILLSGSDGSAILEMLYTKPEWQRQGAASLLFAAAKEALRKRGAANIQVTAQRSNRPAVRLLQRNGFDWQHILQVMPGVDV